MLHDAVGAPVLAFDGLTLGILLPGRVTTMPRLTFVTIFQGAVHTPLASSRDIYQLVSASFEAASALSSCFAPETCLFENIRRSSCAQEAGALPSLERHFYFMSNYTRSGVQQFQGSPMAATDLVVNHEAEGSSGAFPSVLQ